MNASKKNDDHGLTVAQNALAEHLRLLSSGQIEEWVKLFAPDGVLEFPYAPKEMPHRLQGHNELLSYMSDFPEMFNVEFIDLKFHNTSNPGLAIAEFRSQGHAISTGKSYNQVCISVVYTDEEGRITRYLDYWNPLLAMEALTPQ